MRNRYHEISLGVFLHVLPSAQESFSEFILNFCHVENVLRVVSDAAD